MNPLNWSSHLAVCSWSLRPSSLHDLLEQLKRLELPRVQIALDPIRVQPELWPAGLFERNQIALVSGMFGTVGEDYSTMESIRRTGGLVPDATWEQNWKNIQTTAELARRMGLNLVTFHAGFLPHEESDPAFARIFERVSRVADLFASKKIDLAFETGQETAETLRHFLRKLNRPNVGVNFDPANMILYEKGDPIAALKTLGPWLKSCHLKDAKKTREPGTWGEEVPAGAGEVDWPGFFRTLGEEKFVGDLCIEREAGDQRLVDIQSARDFVRQLFSK